MQSETLKLRIPNPHGDDIHIGLLKEILRQGNISWQDWEKARE
jgi:predicted RNA binding protein YcfA (HicA-like mRNA interferase family)